MEENLSRIEKRLEKIEQRLENLEGAKFQPTEVKEQKKTHGSALPFFGIVLSALILWFSLPGLIFGSRLFRFSIEDWVFPGVGAFILGISIYALRKRKKDEAESPTHLPQTGEVFTLAVDESKKPKEPQNVEFKIASWWFAVIGITAIIFGVAFFLKFAFDRGLIGPFGQVAIGVAFGIVLLASGEFLRSKYTKYSYLITGGGIVVLYLSFWASFAIFKLTDQVSTLAFISVVTIFSAILAIRYKALPIAILGIAGAFATPLLIAKGFDNQFLLMGYLVILNLGVLAVSIASKWDVLRILGLGGTYINFYGWYSSYYKEGDLWKTLAFLTIVFLIHGVTLYIYNYIKMKKTGDMDILSEVANGLAYFGFGYFLLEPKHDNWTGLFTFSLFAFYFFQYYFSLQRFKGAVSKAALGLFILSMFFLTVAVPIQFEKRLVEIVWAILSVILLVAGFWLPSLRARAVGLIVYLLAVIKILFFGSILPSAEFSLIINKRFGTFVIAILALSVGALLYKKFKASILPDELKVLPVLIIGLNLVTVWAISLESISYFNKRIEAVRAGSQETKILGYNMQSKAVSSYVEIGCTSQQTDVYILGATKGCQQSKYVIQRYSFDFSIPKGSKINSAFIQFISQKTGDTPLSVKINADPDFYGVGSSKSIIWNINQTWTQGLTVATPDLSTILQESLDSPSWNGFGKFVLNFDSSGSSTFREVRKSNPPSLIIGYTFPETLAPAIGQRALPSPKVTIAPIAQTATPGQLKAIKDLESARDISLSIIWGLYSIVLIIIGIVSKYKPLRMAAMVLLAITIFKVFLFDSRFLDTMYRIGAFIILGGILLTISLVYQKYRHQVGEFLKEN